MADVRNMFDVLEVPDEADDAATTGSKKKVDKKEKKPRKTKREFERHSGTGRGKEVRKGGAGKGGWGSTNPRDEMAASGRVRADPNDDDAAPTGDSEEPEVKAVAYEDYLKSLEENRPADDKVTTRAAQVDKKFAKGSELKKGDKDEETLFPELVKNKKKKGRKQKGKKLVHLDEFVAEHGGPLPPRERSDDLEAVAEAADVDADVEAAVDAVEAVEDADAVATALVVEAVDAAEAVEDVAVEEVTALVVEAVAAVEAPAEEPLAAAVEDASTSTTRTPSPPSEATKSSNPRLRPLACQVPSAPSTSLCPSKGTAVARWRDRHGQLFKASLRFPLSLWTTMFSPPSLPSSVLCT
eukprot:CAMPEP_0183344358 /NCGR_PEP_ID=MMETSP0164_2-20130417/10062_1 /TAXON_ID=221442 /ORGANISM="Coccolithus pelagicus ssp braarudi, Strain PLY182g" /LENGTH=353 /DNA_ID=CAMNT_0025515347 /DNA_START=54 /DNA_END=1116 /DNA_ORIENTATION=+